MVMKLLIIKWVPVKGVAFDKTNRTLYLTIHHRENHIPIKINVTN